MKPRSFNLPIFSFTSSISNFWGSGSFGSSAISFILARRISISLLISSIRSAAGWFFTYSLHSWSRTAITMSARFLSITTSLRTFSIPTRIFLRLIASRTEMHRSTARPALTTHTKTPSAIFGITASTCKIAGCNTSFINIVKNPQATEEDRQIYPL